MLSKNVMTLAAICGTFALAGCGAFETKGKGKKSDQTDYELAGTWTSACLKLDLLGLSRSSETYKFSALGDFDKTTTVFLDDGCQQPALDETVSGTADSLGADATVQDAKDINFTVTKATLTPRSDKAVQLLNDASYCGLTGWEKDKAVDVLGKDCAGEDWQNGEVIYDVYKRDGDQLRFGASMIFFDKTDAGERPTKLEDERVFTRK